MLDRILIVPFLVGVCVSIHAIGLMIGIRWVQGRTESVSGSFWLRVRLLIVIALWIILLHLVEIWVWATFYVWREAIPDIHSAFYFSAVTYTTTGYGDVLLPDSWRWISGVEALTGILMCGASTGFFFAVFSRMHEKDGPTAA